MAESHISVLIQIYSQERAIMDERFEDIPTLHSTLHDHYTTLKMLFSSGSTWQGVGQRAQPGLHVQSCCHYLHVECYKTYSDSQRSRGTDPLHNPLKGLLLILGDWFICWGTGGGRACAGWVCVQAGQGWVCASWAGLKLSPFYRRSVTQASDSCI